MLLNTSFNNNVEPIVDSAEDAIACFLTTGLHYLIIGDCLIAKKDVTPSVYLNLIPSLPLYARLSRIKKYISYAEMTNVFQITNSYSNRYSMPTSPQVFELLTSADGKRSANQLLSERGIEDSKQQEAIINEMIELWAQRLIILNPQ